MDARSMAPVACRFEFEVRVGLQLHDRRWPCAFARANRGGGAWQRTRLSPTSGGERRRLRAEGARRPAGEGLGGAPCPASLAPRRLDARSGRQGAALMPVVAAKAVVDCTCAGAGAGLIVFCDMGLGGSKRPSLGSMVGVACGNVLFAPLPYSPGHLADLDEVPISALTSSTACATRRSRSTSASGSARATQSIPRSRSYSRSRSPAASWEWPATISTRARWASRSLA